MNEQDRKQTIEQFLRGRSRAEIEYGVVVVRESGSTNGTCNVSWACAGPLITECHLSDTVGDVLDRIEEANKSQAERWREHQKRMLGGFMGDREIAELADEVVAKRIKPRLFNVHCEGHFCGVFYADQPVSRVLETVENVMAQRERQERADAEPSKPSPKKEPTPKPEPEPKPADLAAELRQKIVEAEAAATEVLAGLGKLDDLGVYTYRIEENVREGVVGLVRTSLVKWLQEEAPLYDTSRVEHLIKDVRRGAPKTTPLQVFDLLMEDFQKSARQEARKRIERIVRAASPWSDDPIRPYKRVARISCNLFASNNGKPDLYRCQEKLQAMEIMLSELLEEHVELVKPVKAAIQDGKATEKIKVGSLCTHIRFYKKGVADLYFQSEEIADQVAELLHPKAPGDHHTYKWPPRAVPAKNHTHYGRCKICGAPARNPRHSLENETLLQLRDVVFNQPSRPVFGWGHNKAPEKYRDTQLQVAKKRLKLHREIFEDVQF